MAIRSPLSETEKRNRLAAEIRARKSGNHAGWSKREIEEMEKSDEEYRKQMAELREMTLKVRRRA